MPAVTTDMFLFFKIDQSQLPIFLMVLDRWTCNYEIFREYGESLVPLWHWILPIRSVDRSPCCTINRHDFHRVLSGNGIFFRKIARSSIFVAVAQQLNTLLSARFTDATAIYAWFHNVARNYKFDAFKMRRFAMKAHLSLSGGARV